MTYVQVENLSVFNRSATLGAGRDFRAFRGNFGRARGTEMQAKPKEGITIRILFFTVATHNSRVVSFYSLPLGNI